MIENITGPMGGLFAAAFGSGCVAGYGFATRTVMNEAKARITKLEARVQQLTDQLIAGGRP